MNVCTVSDQHYLTRGLAMYASLERHVRMTDVTLHWLCMDEVIYAQLQKLSLQGVILYNIADLENEFPELRQAKNNPPSYYAKGSTHIQYCWACTPFFTWYLVCQKELADVLYADADIFFYGDPRIIFEVMGKRSVGIHTHRFSGKLEDQEKLPDGIGTTNQTGWYNVGVVAFRGTVQSRGITIMWKNWLLKTDHCFYKDYGSSGDQKYLEIFLPLFGGGNVCVFDKYEFDEVRQYPKIMHKAPWCVEGPENILFYHFSHFNYDLGSNTWRDHNNIHEPEWRPATYAGIGNLYENYFQEIKKAVALLS